MWSSGFHHCSLPRRSAAQILVREKFYTIIFHHCFVRFVDTEADISNFRNINTRSALDEDDEDARAA